MGNGWLFLAAYLSSGFAGLVYEVAWTRLLTLYMGHTTAAASTVLAAFMGGMGLGAAVGGRVATRFTPRRALHAYIGLELLILLTALALPSVLGTVRPLLAWAYRDGAGGSLFPLVRLACALGTLVVPAAALGATFPMAVRWFVRGQGRVGWAGGQVYAANTAGAAVGALGAGFFLIPWLGLSGTIWVGALASSASIAIALIVARGPELSEEPATTKAARRAGLTKPGRRTAGREAHATDRFPVALTVVAITGCATFLYEISWTRVLAMVLGPSTYAFAAMLTSFITGLAGGAVVGAALVARVARPAFALAVALVGSAVAATWASAAAGTDLPRLIVRDVAGSDLALSDLLMRHALMVALVVCPTAIGLGVAFPLALELSGARERPAARLGMVYAVNTLASVGGALAAGFVLIPRIGLQRTLHLASALLLAGAAVVLIRAVAAGRGRLIGLLATGAAAAFLIWRPVWDQELLASGAYKYARQVLATALVEPVLKAGTLVYYREGATATVSVKRLTGQLSLSIDGKIDASTGGDMLTQKTLAHLPLLLHPNPRTVAVIGLGSGVTAGSALVHPVESVDVIEISPEVVEASSHFADVNRRALVDPRTRLIVGDGRSHLALTSQTYDVIISEPSNPWMAGVAALFTREFFSEARDRLRPGGILCQWAHTYDISPDDLKSIAATFASVFPFGTMWLVGDGDLLFVGSAESLEPAVAHVEAAWRRPGVADDLAQVLVLDPFALLSVYVGGPRELARYASGAAIQIDDRMALEFTGPAAVNTPAAAANVAALRGLLDPGARPDSIARLIETAGAAERRNRGAMFLHAGAYGPAFEDYSAAVALGPADPLALEGFVEAAVAARRQSDAVTLLTRAAVSHPAVPAIGTALSKLHAAMGTFDKAVESAVGALSTTPPDPGALEQLASVYSDMGDAQRLEAVAGELRRLFPDRPRTPYYEAGAQFLSGQLVPALASVREAIARDPRYAAAQNLLGAIHATRQQRQEARDAFRAALTADPQDTTAYTNLATLELTAGNRDLAVDLFAEALSLDPASETAARGLMQAFLAQ